MAPGNRSSLIGVQPLPIISENPDATPPTTPPQEASPKRRSLPSQPPRRTPPPFTIQERLLQTPPPSVDPTHLPPAPPLRHHRQHSNSSASREKPPLIPLPEPEKNWFARKGGWYRLALYAGIFIVIIVGLGVGLSVGLKKGSSNTGTNSSGNSGAITSNPSSTNDSLPTGTFAFITTLVNMSSTCSKEWTCSPLGTDNEDSMEATFHWAISRLASGGYGLSDEAADDPLGIAAFANVSMSLMDVGGSNERLQLTLVADKTVVIDNKTTCYFTDASIMATIWASMSQDNFVPPYTITATETVSKTPTPTATKATQEATTLRTSEKTSTPTTSSSAKATTTSAMETKREAIRRLRKRESQWEHAVSVVQTATGSPTCRTLGARAVEGPRQVKREENQCACWYSNFA